MEKKGKMTGQEKGKGKEGNERKEERERTVK